MNPFAHKFSRVRVIPLIVLVLLLVAITAGVAISSYEEHCVEQVLSVDQTESEEVVVPARCFRTQAEAIRYATGGSVDLPDNATQEEINEALRQQ
jgi:hypothetical protein